jgi:hypothetical protein
MKKEDEILAQILKVVKLDTPSTDFTKNLLDYLKIEEQLFLDMDSILHEKLNRKLIPTISNDFTGRVMVAIEERKSTSVFKPLISKKSRIAIFSVILINLFILYQEATLEVFYISERTLDQITWFKDYFEISPILSVGFLCLASLLLLDSFLRKEGRFY